MTRTEPSRRQFLCSLGAAGCAVALAPALQGCETAEVHQGPVFAALFEFDLAQARFAPLKVAGGMVGAEAGGSKFVIIRVSDKQIVALSSTCSHDPACGNLAPELDGGVGSWDLTANVLVCGCHFSEYGADGSVKHGPAPKNKPLKAYAVTFDAATGKGSVQT